MQKQNKPIMPKEKRYLYKIEVDTLNKLKSRALLETIDRGTNVYIKDIIDRAIEKEIKNFKPLTWRNSKGV